MYPAVIRGPPMHALCRQSAISSTSRQAQSRHGLSSSFWNFLEINDLDGKRKAYAVKAAINAASPNQRLGPYVASRPWPWKRCRAWTKLMRAKMLARPLVRDPKSWTGISLLPVLLIQGTYRLLKLSGNDREKDQASTRAHELNLQQTSGSRWGPTCTWAPAPATGRGRHWRQS